jgi:hypothetical protein
MPPIPGLKEGAEAGAEAAGAEAAGVALAAGGRRAAVGTAIACVFAGAGVAVTVGATPPGILIVGIPMIVAERGG